MRREIILFTLTASLMLTAGLARSEDRNPKSPADPVADGAWLRPAQGTPAAPVWGHKDGLAVGLWPTNGPRGLIRVYAPYLGQRRSRMVNFISFEPIVEGERGLSELEVGESSGRRGLEMWAADTLQAAAAPGDPTRPPAGRIEQIDGHEALTFYVATEPFQNGARPIVQVILRQDRPHEVGFRVYAAQRSAPMEACVLSATMGNYARLRRLWLRGQVVDAREVWPEFDPDPLGFSPWREWESDQLFQQNGKIIVAATTNETNPARAEYAPAVPPAWRYQGKPATQYWRTADAEGILVRVNGRRTYWGGDAPIPGGTSFENFELLVPFNEGQELWFGVSPGLPEDLGFDPRWGQNVTDGE